jgi:hypothetical protein
LVTLLLLLHIYTDPEKRMNVTDRQPDAESGLLNCQQKVPTFFPEETYYKWIRRSLSSKLERMTLHLEVPQLETSARVVKRPGYSRPSGQAIYDHICHWSGVWVHHGHRRWHQQQVFLV